MSIHFTRPCGKSYDLPDSRSGKTMRCPFCFELQTVPCRPLLLVDNGPNGPQQGVWPPSPCSC